jgi:hypothetical protein
LLARFEKLAEQYVDGYDGKKADHRAALLSAADYEAADKPGYKPLSAAKIMLIEKYLKALVALKFKPEAITFSILGALKEHADYTYPERGESIYSDHSAAHFRIFKKYMALVKRYEVRQQAVAISWFMGIAYGADDAGSEQGVVVLESYMEALDKAGFAVRSENFGLMNHSGRGGLDGLLRTMSFEKGPGNGTAVGPTLAKKLQPQVLAALKGKERTATADDVSDTLESLAR